MTERALIAMSGGVDSSVAAYLMKESGYDCVGATMALVRSEDTGSGRERACCSLDAVEDARSVACRLGIPYYVFNMRPAFQKEVIDRFVYAYEHGETPEPCIDCNRYLKFDRLYERARLLGCGLVATGHYARIEREDGRWLLKKAADPRRDQSYFLCTMTQEQLAHTRFPLGGLCKEQTRRIAAEQGFYNAGRPDSQDLCFVPDGDYAGFIERCTGRKSPAGDFVDAQGRVLGRHRGVIRYTVGQRRGLGVSAGRPLYVQRIDAAENRVVLCGEEGLYTRRAEAESFNWIAFEKPPARLRAEAKLRAGHGGAPAEVWTGADGRVRVEFDEPQRAVTPGQALVLYRGETVLGGGVIRAAEPAC